MYHFSSHLRLVDVRLFLLSLNGTSIYRLLVIFCVPFLWISFTHIFFVRTGCSATLERFSLLTLVTAKITVNVLLGLLYLFLIDVLIYVVFSKVQSSLSSSAIAPAKIANKIQVKPRFIFVTSIFLFTLFKVEV